MESQRPFMTADGTRIETVAELLQRQLDRCGASSLRPNEGRARILLSRPRQLGHAPSTEPK